MECLQLRLRKVVNDQYQVSTGPLRYSASWEKLDQMLRTKQNDLKPSTVNFAYMK